MGVEVDDAEVNRQARAPRRLKDELSGGPPTRKVRVAVSSQSGAPFGTRFWKKTPRHAVNEALHGGRAVFAELVDRLILDRQVVLDEVELGDPLLPRPAFGK